MTSCESVCEFVAILPVEALADGKFRVSALDLITVQQGCDWIATHDLTMLDALNATLAEARANAQAGVINTLKIWVLDDVKIIELAQVPAHDREGGFAAASDVVLDGMRKLTRDLQAKHTSTIDWLNSAVDSAAVQAFRARQAAALRGE